MHDITDWQHHHDFRLHDQHHAEQRTHWVIALTAVTMLVEVIAGYLTGSMALLADGWHMATHVGALGIAAFAYRMARHHAADPRFTFGTGKVATLGGYTSAVALGLVALLMVAESLSRFLAPVNVHFSEAMVVAWIGLAVNLISAWLLGHDDHDHDHGHNHHQDHNLRAAYLHVIADSLTSVLAILALWTGSAFGWVWMDPLMGIVGALVIARWAASLLRDSGRVLLDAEDQGPTEEAIRALMEADPDTRIADLHLWRVGQKSRACILSLVTHTPRELSHYKALLAPIPHLDHITVEVNYCMADRCLPLIAECPVPGGDGGLPPQAGRDGDRERG
ncbi:MAG: CDF family Co(II)/Ni(II) efflux transporter DmeF [Gammaproteobacteria bacterium]|nr:CDF family Co(II)/Ni(II) efflux transporter DmeF [Gammaproteobacteria bacterium]MBU1656411.1 CDF family Co(II)/Ni(II) efflux transporter DmeF [Gammaproteobacteria bacterium]MBU1960959.1 CDF family Co(II)/Ni(II) efflux transporter DmeF [Gammaproteobacteria bacterium]